MSEHISISRDEAVLRLGFNRPEKKNAITAAMYATFGGCAGRRRKGR